MEMAQSGPARITTPPAAARTAGFPVWVELRCSTCLDQIVGQSVADGIPFDWLESRARLSGAVRIGKTWLCVSCLRRLAGARGTVVAAGTVA
ncbi:hypothetical protein OM960_18720 [Defluviimonas sp. CAU 1641]|uniref:Uncharacterized protein n=2 Tax=Defluviimonas salinarum TaxID=2992147 RepID=A0ABT3J7B5_9RHOB|nr:hypothetical protein [Defluviimonas salinarum]